MKLFAFSKKTGAIQPRKKKSNKSLFRRINDWLHLWLGLVTGIIVVFVSLTGCILAFEREIRNVTQPYQFVEPQQKPFLLPSQLERSAKLYVYGSDTAKANIYGFEYGDQHKAAVVAFLDPKDGYSMVYLNPYDGTPLAKKALNRDFFRIVLAGHFYLFLPAPIGQPIVAWSILIFVVILMSGLIMWWPKKWNKTNKEKSFKVKWKAGFKRVNYDLHNVLGFYVMLIALVLALTGLVWGFEWFANGSYFVTSGGKKLAKWEEPVSDTLTAQVAAPMTNVDKIYLESVQHYNNPTASIQVSYPNTPTDPITVSYNPDEGTYYKREYRFFDRNTLAALEGGGIYGQEYKKATAADKLYRMNYDIHVGAIGGLTGKIIAFFASFICGSLPITGFIIWYGKKKKKHKKAKANLDIKHPHSAGIK
ncbi:putative iron-regulated membrane protein [Chitinophaga skermanii]|uniref:Putative iron-regulated membrane protein n=1 Tax=Chitinophaga skermanii TaxID=331697 RepID=A0A327QSQ2_9BACT|nr:PepSY-associated TM helix domain-containing protein [Chitinophaga skermanii]RAJ06664.1 putative iron-regulated membrane protein [Chitinophaga skermanii]